MSSFPAETDVDLVSKMFPALPRTSIEQDLNMSCSVGETVDRILDGRFGQSSQGCHEMSSSDDELPDLGISNPIDAVARVTTGSSARTGVIELSDSSDDEEENSIPLRERLGGFSASGSISNRPSTSTSTAAASFLSTAAESYDGTRPKAKTLALKKARSKNDFYSSRSEDEDDLPKVKVHGSEASEGSERQTYDTDSNKSEPLREYYSDATSQLKPKKVSRKRSGPSATTADESDLTEKERQKLQKKREQEEKKRQKELAKQEREEKRLQQKRKKEIEEHEKAKRRMLQEANKYIQKGECLKHISAVIDKAILQEPYGTAVLEAFSKQEIRFDTQEQAIPNIITFFREVKKIVDNGPGKLSSSVFEEVQDDVLYFLPINQFTELVSNLSLEKQGLPTTESGTLRYFTQNMKELLENRNITFIVFGLEEFLEKQKTQKKRAFKNKVQGGHNSGATGQTLINKVNIEEALLDVQLNSGNVFRFVEKKEEMTKTVFHYTKSVAQIPIRRGKFDTGMALFVEGGGVKVSKEGAGLSNLWRQQLQQFKNLSADVANAIMAEYPTPARLCSAYKKCSEKEGELLLKDIVVRRGSGVLANSRKIGKEMSRRVYQLMTISDPDFLIP